MTKTQLATLLQDGLTIDSNTANQRIDRLLRKLFKVAPDISLSVIFKSLRHGDIRIQTSNKAAHKVSASYRLQVGDIIIANDHMIQLVRNSRSEQPDNSTQKKTKPSQPKNNHRFQDHYTLQDFKSRIISEDEHRLILNKPPGIIMHPGNEVRSPSLKNNEFMTLHDGIQLYYADALDQYTTFRPNAGYRLDKYTSGLVIVAKTYPALQHINAVIRDHHITKEYQTIVVGKTPTHLDISSPLKKIVDQRFKRAKMIVSDPDDSYAQSAHTLTRRLSTWIDPVLGPLSLLSVQLETGRMHQIRAHLASLDFPVVGDIVYGHPSFNRKAKQAYDIRRQLLHCWRYSFQDMDGQHRSFEAPLAPVMKNIMPY